MSTFDDQETVRELFRRLREAHLYSSHATSPEGKAARIEPFASAFFPEHTVVLSPAIHDIQGGWLARWYGRETKGKYKVFWYATLEAAVKAISEEYTAKEALWRLGGR